MLGGLSILGAHKVLPYMCTQRGRSAYQRERIMPPSIWTVAPVM